MSEKRIGGSNRKIKRNQNIFKKSLIKMIQVIYQNLSKIKKIKYIF